MLFCFARPFAARYSNPLVVTLRTTRLVADCPRLLPKETDTFSLGQASQDMLTNECLLLKSVLWAINAADGLCHATMRNIEGELNRILQSISGRRFE